MAYGNYPYHEEPNGGESIDNWSFIYQYTLGIIRSCICQPRFFAYYGGG